MKTFAPNIKRTKGGLVDFPTDIKIRKQLWPETHSAKYNCYLVWEVMKYLTEPGQTILDPMSGTGTTMLVALEGRKAFCIEVEDKFHEMQQGLLEKLEKMCPGINNEVTLLHGDCNWFLPMQVDCILFSPPLPGGSKGKSLWNVGNTSDFIYWQRMEKIYKKLAQSAPVMACVVKDRIKDFKRLGLVQETINLCGRTGWKLQENILIYALVAVNKSKGREVVEDESILVFRRK